MNKKIIGWGIIGINSLVLLGNWIRMLVNTDIEYGFNFGLTVLMIFVYIIGFTLVFSKEKEE